jgi:rhamnulokinase
MSTHTILAVDLGAESGRVMAVHYDGGTLRLEELHRFPNTTVAVRGTLHWDFLRLWQDIQDGIAKGLALRPASLGVDTWGVDFALLDAAGDLLGNPVHYRDQRTDGMMEQVFARVDRADVFEQTGIQFMPINTLYQLMSLVERKSPQLAAAHTFLTAPDLLNYWLTGTQVCEFTNATTTQLFDPRAGDWAGGLMDSLGIPRAIFPPIVLPGMRIGAYAGTPVIAPACHDTGSAVAAVPAESPHYAYISSGTWSLVGLEVARPIIGPAALAANVTNEGGVGGTYRLLKNVMGLWIIQQCRATWAAQGLAYSYADLARLAQDAPPFGALIDPNDARFLPHGDHPQLIQAWCAEHGQPVPETHGQIARCVFESLALAYRDVLATLDALAGHTSNVIHVVGGGSRNELLCQMTADATGLPVVAGPVEATVLGNALVQLIALGELADIAEARRLVATMGDLRRYEPRDSARWDEAYARFRQEASGRRMT